MSAQIKTLGKHGVVYGIGIALSRAAGLIMLPLYTRYLTPADYGAVELLMITVDVIGMIVGLGVTGVIFKCFSDAKTRDETNSVISTALLIMLSLMGVMATIGFAFSGQISYFVFGEAGYSKYFQLMFITYFLQQGIISIPLMYIRAMGRPVLFVSLGVAKLSLQIAFNVYFLAGLGLGLMGVVLSAFIAEAVLGAYLLAYAVRHFGFRYSPAHARELIALGYPFVFTSLSSFVLIYSDRFLMKMYVSLEALGIYALAYKFGFALAALAVVPVQSAWEPQRFTIAKQHDGKEVFKRVFLYLNVLVVFLSTAVVVYVGDVLKIISHEAYWPAANLVPLIVAGFVLQSWTFFCDYGIYHARKTSRIALSSAIAAAMIVAMNVVLIPRYGAYGAALSMFIAFLARFGLMFAWAHYYFPIDYGWKRVGVLVFLGVSAYLARLSVDPSDTATALATDSAILLAFVAATYYLVLLRSDRQAIRGVFEGKKGSLRANQAGP